MERTPKRNPLREVKSLNNTPKNYFNITPRKNLSTTPKMSPGPALLLAIKLSCSTKKDLKPLSLKLPEDKENDEVKVEISKPDVKHFRNLLISETSRITLLCEKWDELLLQVQKKANDEQSNLYCALMGDIRTTIGQGRLIMRERFHQFTGLVDNCEYSTSEKPVTCQDLQGFWDMIYFQVEDVDAKFSNLDKCREANWDVGVLEDQTSTTAETTVKITKKKVSKKVSTKMSEAAKARKEEFAKKRAEARKRLAAAKAALKAPGVDEQQAIPTEKERITFDAGFFKIDSPLKSPHSKMLTPGGGLKKQVTTPRNLKEYHSSSPTVLSKSQSSPVLEKNISEEVYRNSSLGETIQKKLEFDGDLRSNINSEKCSDLSLESCANENKPSLQVSTEDIKENVPNSGTYPETCERVTSAVADFGTTKTFSSSGENSKPSSQEMKSNSSELMHNINDADDETRCLDALVNGKSIARSPHLASNKNVDRIVNDSVIEVENLPNLNENSRDSDFNMASADVMNLSIFIDEATRNIKRVSGILQPHKADAFIVTEESCPEKNEDTSSSASLDEATSQRLTTAKLPEAVNNEATLPLQMTLEKILYQHQVLEKRISELQRTTASNGGESSNEKLIEKVFIFIDFYTDKFSKLWPNKVVN